MRSFENSLRAGDDVMVVMIRNGALEEIKGVGDVVVPTRSDRAGTLKKSTFKALTPGNAH